MPKLATLKLNDNKLSHIPPGHLSKNQISRLYLGNNLFETAPNLKGSCANMDYLNVEGNKISKLTTEFLIDCKKLRELQISHNLLTSVSGVNLVGHSLRILVSCRRRTRVLS